MTTGITHKVRYMHAPSDSYRTGYQGDCFEDALANARWWRDVPGIGDVHIVTTLVTAVTLTDVGWERR